jgi:hypothetical protein
LVSKFTNIHIFYTKNTKKSNISAKRYLLHEQIKKPYTKKYQCLTKEIFMDDSPSAFSIAHYVLLFIVATLCTVSVVWVLIAANNREAELHDKQIIRQDKRCQRNAADHITNLWQQRPHEIPPQYKSMEKNYANRVVEVRTTGTCNGERFTCQMGQTRSACDPCAVNSAQKRAMFQHISDAIDDVCNKD